MEDLHKAFQQVGNEINDVGTSFSKMGKDLSSAGGDLTAGVTAPLVAAGAGIALVTNEAVDFQKGMYEVFTLLPGISQQSMDSMTGDVYDFSKEMAVTTDEVVPALYESLSAGVPQDNVFEFMKVAQKAAVGGVTELETTVDGLTSVVNAYGDDVIDAGTASDQMFVAVKLGKTTFEELSQYMYNVVPTASSLGVSFTDVTAALAALTAQGVPTSVATTQLRQLLVELSKQGSQTAETFETLSGKSFTDYIASGGNLQGALEILKQGMGNIIPDVDKLQSALGKLQEPNSKLAKQFKELYGKDFKTFVAEGGNVEEALSRLGIEYGTTYKKVSDYFGSVEAANAALALTGPGAAMFSQALEEERNSLGATEEAYNKMSETADFSLKKIKAELDVLLVKLGEEFLPILKDTIVPLITDTIIPFLEILLPIIGDLAKGFNSLPQPLKVIILAVTALVASLGPILMIIGSIASGIGAIMGLFGAGGALATAGTAISGIVAALIPLAPAILAIIAVAGALYLVFKNWDKIKEFAESPLLYIEQAVYHIFKKIETFLKDYDLSKIILSVFFPVLAIADSVFGTDLIDTIDEAFSEIWEYLEDLDFKNLGKKLFDAFIAGVKIILNQQPYKLVYTVMSKVWSYLSSLNFSALGNALFTRLVTGAKKILDQEPYNSVFNALQSIADYLENLNLGDAAKTLFNTFVKGASLVLTPQPIGLIMGAVGAVITYLGSVDLGTIAQTIFNKFVEYAKRVLDAEPLKSITAALDKVSSYLSGLNYSYLGTYLINTLTNAIKSAINTEPLKSIQEALSKISSAVYSFKLTDAGKAIINSLKSGVDAILQDEPISTIRTELSKISTYISSINLSYTGKNYFQKFVTGISDLLSSEPISTISTGLTKVYSYVSNYDLTQAGKTFLQKLVNGINKILETEPMTSISKAIQGVYNYFNYSSIEYTAQSWFNKFVTGVKDVLKTEPMTSISTTINSTLTYLRNIDLTSAGRHIIETLATGIKNAGSLAYEAVYDILRSISNLLPHSPAKEGPFSVLPNWDALFSDPVSVSMGKMRGTVLSGLENVAQVVNSSTLSSNSITNHYGGDTFSIGPNTFSKDVDLKRLVNEINRYTTNQKRARGLI